MRLVFLAALMTSAAQAAGPAEIALVRGGKPQALSAAAQARIAEKLPQLFSTCSINSRDHPKIFASSDAGKTWRETEANDHLSVRFPTAIEVAPPHKPVITARQLLMGLPEQRYPAPFVSRNADSVVAHTKCSGGDMLRFVCAPDIRPLMPGSYVEQCRFVN
jgi:hypothetical protein